jgi:hypothetical protein
MVMITTMTEKKIWNLLNDWCTVQQLKSRIKASNLKYILLKWLNEGHLELSPKYNPLKKYKFNDFVLYKLKYPSVYKHCESCLNVSLYEHDTILCTSCMRNDTDSIYSSLEQLRSEIKSLKAKVLELAIENYTLKHK